MADECLGMNELQANRRGLTFFDVFLREASLFEFRPMAIHPNPQFGIGLILRGNIAVSMFTFVFYEYTETRAPFLFYFPDESNGVESIYALLS